MLAKPAKELNQHSHLFSILLCETAQILLSVGTSKTKASNVSLRWRIDRLLRSFRQLSEGETLGLMMSGKLGAVSQYYVK